MPRFYFHLHDGQDLPDHEGQDFPDLRAARAYAAEFVYLQLKEDANTGRMDYGWTLEIRDERQETLFAMRFTSIEGG